MSASNQSRPIGRTKALPLVRMTVACQNRDEFRHEFLERFMTQGVFVPTDRVRPVGERIRFKIELLNCTADYSSDAVVTGHEWNDSKFGMRLRLDAADPRPLALASKPPPCTEPPVDITDEALPCEAAVDEELEDVLDDRPLAVCLADYLYGPEVTSTPAGEPRGGDRAASDRQPAPLRAVKPIEAQCRAHWPPSVRQILKRPSIEAIECLHRTSVKARDLEPTTALAAAEAMVDLAQSDPCGELVRFVRLLTRDGHEILELALENLETAQTTEVRREAQQLFDDTLKTVVVP